MATGYISINTVNKLFKLLKIPEEPKVVPQGSDASNVNKLYNVNKVYQLFKLLKVPEEH